MGSGAFGHVYRAIEKIDNPTGVGIWRPPGRDDYTRLDTDI
jgi:hypothetical protein